MLTRMWSNRNFHSLLVGIQNGIDSLEDSLAVFFFFIKLNVSIPYDLEITLGRYPKELKTYVCTEKLHTDVYK